MNLAQLPYEITSQILGHLQYYDCLQALSCCNALHAFSNDQILWRDVFLWDFDHPHERLHVLTATARNDYLLKYGSIDWRKELRKRVVALRCFRSPEEALTQCDPHEYELFANTILDIIDTSSTSSTSLNIQLLPKNSEFIQEVDSLIRGTLRPRVTFLSLGKPSASDESGTATNTSDSVWEPSPGKPLTRSRAALQADKTLRPESASRLHVLCGFTAYEGTDEKSAGRARRICYDWSLTNERNEFGPWKDDGSGRTDWKRVEAIVTIVTRRFIRAARRRVTLPQGFRYSIPSQVPISPTVPMDWAGAQRKWIGTYVFMHWEDLVEFNEFRDTTSRPTLENMPEACGGVMKLDLKLDMDLSDDPKLQTKLAWCNDVSPLYFSGLSRSEDWQMATNIRGMCEYCNALNAVMKTSESGPSMVVSHPAAEKCDGVILSSADQWQLEGVQPGGPRSGPVYGTWTSATHDDDGPVGPFLYVPEDLCLGD